jgi:hypothetical protein
LKKNLIKLSTLYDGDYEVELWNEMVELDGADL